MNRIKDYACFAACFAGLGYIVLGPFIASKSGASLLCGDHNAAGLFGFVCPSAPLRLPSGLHALGFMSALFVVARAMIGTVKRSSGDSSLTVELEGSDETPVPPSKPLLALRRVEPRSQFGLRGTRR